jgi:hypothetical protein
MLSLSKYKSIRVQQLNFGMCRKTSALTLNNLNSVKDMFNPLKTTLICFIQGLSAYCAVNTPHFGYKNQSLNVL